MSETKVMELSCENYFMFGIYNLKFTHQDLTSAMLTCEHQKCSKYKQSYFWYLGAIRNLLISWFILVPPCLVSFSRPGRGRKGPGAAICT